MRTLVTFLTLLLCFAATGIQAQITEEQVDDEKIFIEASRERMMGNYDRAVELLRDLFRKQGDNGAIAFELGRNLLALKKNQEAISFLKKAVDLEPSNTWYIEFLGNTYLQNNLYLDGAQLYQQMANANPEEDDHYYNWALFLERAQRVQEALGVYNTLEKKRGVQENITLLKHSLYLKSGDAKNAANELLKLVQAFPEVPHYRHLLAAYYLSKGEDAEARKVYQQIVSKWPDDAKAKLALSAEPATAAASGMLALRELFARQDLSVDDKIARLLPALQQVVNDGDEALANEVIALADIIKQTHPGDAKPYAVAADMYFYTGRRKAALEQYKLTIQRDKKVYTVWEQYLLTLYYLRDFNALVDATNNALDLFPNKFRLQYFLAIGAIEQKQYDQALDAIQLANLIAGGQTEFSADLLALTGHINSLQNRQQLALESFSESAKMAPNGLELALRQGQHHLSNNGAEKALPLLAFAASAAPDNPYCTFYYGKALFATASFAKAEDQIAQALKQSDDMWPAALELMGDIRYKLNDVDGAVAWWQKAIEKQPNPAIQTKITNRSL